VLVIAVYVSNPEATANIVDNDGWPHAGDIAFIDGDEEMFIPLTVYFETGESPNQVRLEGFFFCSVVSLGFRS
jgi:acyl-CoA synthetase (AMP-forming)/AMP-acid ligase II